MNEKNSQMKIIAFYLPQYHAIPENDEWWGKGFTEWTNVRKARPSFEGHVQPKKPLNDNYYNLLDDNTKIWQANLANKYGVYGFCYYHYWFNGKLLLEKPAEQMLKNKEVDIPFCFSWANEPWTRSWDGKESKVIMSQSYGDQNDWDEHFYYLLKFFKDERYIKKDNKPMFLIYKPDIIPQCTEMIKRWEVLAKKAGFNGIYLGYQFPSAFKGNINREIFDFGIEFEPIYTNYEMANFENIGTLEGKIKMLLNNPKHFINTLMNKTLTKLFKRPIVFNYDKTYNRILNRKPKFDHAVPGVFVSWDKTPRRGLEADVYKGSTPDKFQKYLSTQIKRAKEIYNTDLIFVTAWNEWGEGSYLEPDCENGYAYLEAVKNAISENK